MALHELRTQLTSASLAALVLLLVAATSTLNPVAMIPGGSDTNVPVRAVANSVYALSPTFALSGFFVYPFFAALMAGLSTLRDDEAGVSELLHSTPLTRGEYVWTKFVGVLGALMIVACLHVLIVIGFRELAVGGVARGPFDLWAYVLPAALFVVPGVVWTAGLTFAIGARTKAPMAVYALPVALFVLEFELLWNWHPRDLEPALDALLMVLDPTGLRWLTHSLFSDDRGIVWYNSAPLAVDRVLLIGRMVTVLVPLAAVALLTRGSRRPQFASVRSSQWQRLIGALRAPIDAPSATHSPTHSPSPLFGGTRLTTRRGTLAALRATTTVLMSELRETVRQPSGYLFAAFLFAVVAEVGGADADAYGSMAVLTAGGIALNALPAVTVLMCLYLLFVIVESLHRDRATGFESIAHSTSVPTASFIVGKALAATTLIALFTTVCVLSGATLLLAQPGPSVSIWPLVLVFGAVLGPTFILWTAFVTAVMSRVRSRAGTLAVGFIALLLTAAQFIRGSMTWLTNWPLWGSLRWTEFALFPLDAEALILNRMLALTLALVLFGAARLMFVRTERDPAASRRRRTPAAIARLALRASPLIALPLVTSAFLAVRVHDAFDGPAVARAAAAYEVSNQREWASVIPAVIQHIDVSVAIEPARREMSVDGTYDLVNRTSNPMTTLPFTVPFTFGPVQWRVGGEPATSSGVSGLERLALSAPLAPGDTVRVGFRYTARINAGVSTNGGPVDAFVLPSGVLLSTQRGDFLPIPGYREVTTVLAAVSNTDESPVDRSGDTTTSAVTDAPAFFNRGWAFTATMRVRAPSTLTINGVGHRSSSSTQDEYTHVTWTTNVPVSALNLVGARYAVARAEGVAVYHHPSHARSLDLIVNTLAAARRHYASWFHPYPWDELRLNEYADLSSQATSYPTNIAFSEGMGFLTTEAEHGGLAFAVTAHEAAHQWWGHMLRAGTGPGTGLLVEGMADYATLLLYDAERGTAARRAYAVLLERQYLDGRSAVREQALADTRESTSSDEAVLQKKGAWAMWMLHNSLGAQQTFAGLRAFIADHRAPGRFATPEGLLLALRRQSPDTIVFDERVLQWFRSTQLPSFTLDNARCAADVNGWLCETTLRNVGTGNAMVDVAAMQGDSVMRGGLTSANVRAGRPVNLQWRLSSMPDRFVVDPDVQVLQARRGQAVARPAEARAR